MKYGLVEIFESLQGEGRNAGRPCVFVRFAGCNLSCPWCDTDVAPRFSLTLDELVAEVKSFRAKSVVLTGGEPTTVAGMPELVAALKREGYWIAVETNGSVDAPWLAFVDYVACSPKLEFPGSLALSAADEVRVVASDEGAAAFCEEVGAALLKENRRIVLITDQGELIGFLQYYTNDTTFMIEEAQLKRAYQGRGIMKRFFDDIAAQVPQNIPYVEAFTHKNNEIPQEILRRHGFVCIDENCNGRFCHFRGDCGAFFAALTQKRSAADCFSEQSIKV